jgi:hypothetical protein
MNESMYTNWLRLAFASVLAIAWQAPTAGAQSAAKQANRSATLEEIVENVRASEALYANIEVLRRKTYRLYDVPDPPATAVKTGRSESRFVYQRGMIYLKNDESLKGIDGKDYDESVLEGYDGKSMRIVEQGLVANIRNDRIEDPRLFRPHCFCLRLEFPMSAFLQGGEIVRTYPRFRHTAVTVRYVGDEMRENLRCHKLRVDHKLDSWPEEHGTDVRYFWLAIDRNYLPIRTECLRQFQRDGEPPLEVGWVDDLREIAPGIWFPFHAQSDVYDVPTYSASKKLLLQNTTEFTVTKASLDPDYDVSLFRDIPIPNGAQVHVIENGVTVRSYTQGGRHTISPSRSVPWQWAAIGIVLVGTISAGGYMRYRRDRKADKLRGRRMCA